MTFPTRWSVGVRRFESAGDDGHGNPVDGHAEAVLNLPVYFVAPATSVEPYRDNRDLLTTDLAVMCPKAENVPTSRDLVIWQDEDYSVEGDVADYTYGPWTGPGSDITFIIRRVEG